MSFDYSNSYWNSCKFRFKNRRSKIHLDIKLEDNIEILQYKDEIVTAYYLLHNEELIGTIAGHVNSDGFYISISSINPEKIKRGYGTILYEHVLNKHKCIVSDTDRTILAECMWDKLKRKYPNCSYKEGRYFLTI